MLVTACDRTISLWDLLSLQCIGSLKGHRDEVRALLVHNQALFSAGKSGKDDAPALLMWDLRKASCLLEEREPNQDIFSLAASNNQLCAGTRNHSVLRYSLEGGTLKPLDNLLPQHYDAVQSLAVMDGRLISGARDGHLRVWQMPDGEDYRLHKQAHSDWLTALTRKLLSSDPSGPVGAHALQRVSTRRGQGLALRTRQAQVSHQDPGTYSKKVHDMKQQPINALCSVRSGGALALVTGSMDRSIRIFKVKKQHVGLLD